MSNQKSKTCSLCARDNNKIIQNYNIPDNTDTNNIKKITQMSISYLDFQQQYTYQHQFKTKRMKQPKFNTKRYHNIHQPGRTNCDQRSRV